MPETIASSSAGDATILIDTTITPELEAEGWARDVVRHIQQLRKDRDLSITDHIALLLGTSSPELRAAVQQWRATIKAETLSDSLVLAEEAVGERVVKVGPAEVSVELEKVG
jgi:isoleucyl-tRNA synthetase